eukprot:3707529-Lingulodinium_polyedra.AAC.1
MSAAMSAAVCHFPRRPARVVCARVRPRYGDMCPRGVAFPQVFVGLDRAVHSSMSWCIPNVIFGGARAMPRCQR